MALFAVVQIERDDFDSPVIKFIEALTDVEAFEKFAVLTGFTMEELEEGEEMGEIYISIRECVEDPKDKNGVGILEGEDVNVIEPEPDDLWNHGFSGTVIKIHLDKGYATIKDGDGDCWDVDFEKIEVE